jgi:hypothetical protein
MSDSLALEVSQPQAGSSDVQHHEAKCCCGRPDCAFLRHNNVALDGLEKDVQNAAQLGQVSTLAVYAWAHWPSFFQFPTRVFTIPRDRSRHADIDGSTRSKVDEQCR